VNSALSNAVGKKWIGSEVTETSQYYAAGLEGKNSPSSRKQMDGEADQSARHYVESGLKKARFGDMLEHTP
jgi:hypothetical protein